MTFLAVILSVWFIFLASITFGDGFFQFKDNNNVSLKQAPGHNDENTIFHPGQGPMGKINGGGGGGGEGVGLRKSPRVLM